MNVFDKRKVLSPADECNQEVEAQAVVEDFSFKSLEIIADEITDVVFSNGDGSRMESSVGELKVSVMKSGYRVELLAMTIVRFEIPGSSACFDVCLSPEGSSCHPRGLKRFLSRCDEDVGANGVLAKKRAIWGIINARHLTSP